LDLHRLEKNKKRSRLNHSGHSQAPLPTKNKASVLLHSYKISTNGAASRKPVTFGMAVKFTVKTAIKTGSLINSFLSPSILYSPP